MKPKWIRLSLVRRVLGGDRPEEDVVSSVDLPYPLTGRRPRTG